MGELYDILKASGLRGGAGGGSGFTPTQDQLDAMNSGIDSEKVDQIATNETNISFVENLTIEDYFEPDEYVGTVTQNQTAQRRNDGIHATTSAASNNYSMIEWIVDSNVEHIKIHCYATTDAKYGVGFFCLKSDDTIVYQYNSDGAGTYDIELDIPAGTYKIWANGYKFTPSILIYDKSKRAKSYTRAEIDNKFIGIEPYTDISLFIRYGVIGDSYASGGVYYSGAMHNEYSISWGQILARKHGITCTNYSTGGLSTRSWLTSEYGLTLLNSSTSDNLYLLALGINDCALGTEYIGDITDITDYESPEYYADSFYGNYGRIIEAVKTHAPNAKLILFDICKTGTTVDLFNSAISSIAEYYEIPLIHQNTDSYFQSETYTDMVSDHPTGIGYSGMACAFDRLIAKCMVDNHSYFKNAMMYAL